MVEVIVILLIHVICIVLLYMAMKYVYKKEGSNLGFYEWLGDVFDVDTDIPPIVALMHLPIFTEVILVVVIYAIIEDKWF